MMDAGLINCCISQLICPGDICGLRKSRSIRCHEVLRALQVILSGLKRITLMLKKNYLPHRVLDQ